MVITDLNFNCVSIQFLAARAYLSPPQAALGQISYQRNHIQNFDPVGHVSPYKASLTDVTIDAKALYLPITGSFCQASFATAAATRARALTGVRGTFTGTGGCARARRGPQEMPCQPSEKS